MDLTLSTPEVKKMRSRLVRILCLLLLLNSFAGLAQAEAVKIEQVEAVLDAPGFPPPEKVAKRMEKSVQTIGEHILLGHRPEEVTEAHDSYERLIREVFDRVLVGYSVKQVQITTGITTKLYVEVEPWGETVRQVDVTLDMAGLSPAAQELVRGDITGLQNTIQNVLLGLPVEAVDWASGITKALLREMLAEQLPEFRTNLEINSGVKTIVNVSLAPVGTTVQDVSVAIHSRTIPNLLLLEAKPTVEKSAEILRGLPVEFVERHKAFFVERIRSAAAGHPVTARYGLTLNPFLRIGTETEVILNVDTDKYKVWLEGYLDMDRSKDNTSVKGHLGKNISKTDEVFTEITFVPGAVKWIFEPGWGHRLGSNATVGFKANSTHWYGVEYFQQQLSPLWSLRLERTAALNHNELGIRYKIHEFLSAEYIITSEENWLRLVGNL